MRNFLIFSAIWVVLLSSLLSGCSAGSGGGTISDAPFTLTPDSISVSTEEGKSVSLVSTLTVNTNIVPGYAYIAYIDSENVAQSNVSFEQTSSTTGIITFHTNTTLAIGVHAGTIDVLACKDSGCNNLYGSGTVTLNYTVTVNEASQAATITPSSINVTGEKDELITVSLTAQISSGRSVSAFAIADANELFSSTVSATYQSGNVYSLTATVGAISQVGTYTGTLSIYLCTYSPCSASTDVAGSPVIVPYTITVNEASQAAAIIPSSINVTAETDDLITVPLTAQISSGRSVSAFAIADANGLFSSTVSATYQSSNVYSLTATIGAINQVGTYTGTLSIYLCTYSPCSASTDVAGSPVTVPYTITITPMTLLSPVATSTGLPEWSTYQGNAAHTGYVPVTLDSSHFSASWTWSNPNSATGYLTPVTTGSGKVVAVSSGYFSNAYLYAINESSGVTDWQYSFGSIFAVNHPAVADGRIFVASSGDEDTFLWSFDINDGSLKYKTAFSSQWDYYLAPVVKGGYVYTNGGYYGGLYRFKESTGTFKWFADLDQYDLWSPAVDDSYAYAYTGYSFHAINLADGSGAFQVNNSSFNWWGYSLNDAPVLPGDGSILVVDGVFDNSYAHANNLIRYSVSGQDESWRVNGSFGSDPVVANGILYVVNAATNALEARSVSTGALLWSWIPGGSGETVAVNNLILTSNMVFVGTSAATYAIDLTTHLSVWSDPHTGHLAMSSNKVLYITSGTQIRAYKLE